MDIGKAVPDWLTQLAKDVAEAWELPGEIGWHIDYEYAGSMPPHPRDTENEDLWHLTIFPLEVEHEGHTVVPDGSVDLLAVQGLLETVDDASFSGDGTVRISGTKNNAMVMINLRCFPPDNAD
jgi:hypothetical protein